MQRKNDLANLKEKDVFELRDTYLQAKEEVEKASENLVGHQESIPEFFFQVAQGYFLGNENRKSVEELIDKSDYSDMLEFSQHYYEKEEKLPFLFLAAAAITTMSDLWNTWNDEYFGRLYEVL